MLLLGTMALAAASAAARVKEVAETATKRQVAGGAIAVSALVVVVALLERKRVMDARDGRKPTKPATMDAAVALTRAVAAAAAVVFTAATWYLLAVDPIEVRGTGKLTIGGEATPLMARLAKMKWEQLAAVVAMSMSVLALLTSAGMGLLAPEFESEARAAKSRATKSRLTYVEAFAVVALAIETAYVAWTTGTTVASHLANTLNQHHHLHNNNNNNNTSFMTVGILNVRGLAWGLAWAGIGQVLVFAYHYTRRELGWLRHGYEAIQPNRPPSYALGFWRQTFNHFAQPSAFMLMGAYLSGTWVLDLMPASYYDYDAPVDWSHVLAQLVVVDMFTFTNHVAEHAIPALYRASHKPHHVYVSPQMHDAFDGSLADTTGLILLPLFCTMRSLAFVHTWSYIAFGFVYSTWFVMIHSEWPHPLDDLASVVGVYTARDHHGHHALFNKNFAHFFVWWDSLAGTRERFSPLPLAASAEGGDSRRE